MKLTGLHLLLTYKCTNECDHCFVFGSPRQSGTMTIPKIMEILRQAKDSKTITSIYFEGGEPFLFYPIMVRGVRDAKEMGFDVGIVTNGYWAAEAEDALEWLRPLNGLIDDLSVSSDLYHWNEMIEIYASNTKKAALELGIPVGYICIAQPVEENSGSAANQIPEEEIKVRYRGRAAENLVKYAEMIQWEEFSECPHEDLKDPGRVHVDAFGNLQICQGISIGNMFKKPLKEICDIYNPEDDPVIGPILKGGPAELVRKYNISHKEKYADACHLCFETRSSLKDNFPEILTPCQSYRIVEEY
ncbi:radical SAM protein [candidate division KSB1 bacterium]